MIYIILSLLGSMYLLWLFFLAVMSLKKAKENGTLGAAAKVFGYPILWIGLFIDFVVNTTFMTLLLLEFPKWTSGELLVTSRLKRTRKEGSGWRLSIANWFVPLLNPFDPDHI